jgi:hypothetical protein
MPSLSSQIVALLRFLDHTLDSFWVWAISKLASLKSKGTSAQRIPGTKIESPSPRQTRPIIKAAEWFVGLFSLAVAVTAFWLSYLVPKLSVDVSGSLQAANPLSSIFVLTNEGSLPIHKVLASCGQPQFNAGRFIWKSGPNGKIIFGNRSRADILTPGHHMTLPCGHMFSFADPSTITEAEVTIIVDYRPDWLPFWPHSARFPWKAEKSVDGKWVWDSLPQ